MNFTDLQIPFDEAENYFKPNNKEKLNRLFYKDRNYNKLLNDTTYFLIGEKGSGKTPSVIPLPFSGFFLLRHLSSVISFAQDATRSSASATSEPCTASPSPKEAPMQISFSACSQTPRPLPS